MAKIYYARTDEFWRKGEKYAFLEEREHVGGVEWQELQPDAKGNWLTIGNQSEFERFLAIGDKEAKQAGQERVETIFKLFGPGTNTSRDVVVYDFIENALLEKVKKHSETYNSEVDRYRRSGKPRNVDDFIRYDHLKWSAHLKSKLVSQQQVEFNPAKVIKALYRPFTTKLLYADTILIDRLGLQKNIFPAGKDELENQAVCVAGIGDRKGFGCLLTSHTPSYDLAFEKTQYFPFYTYNEDGTNRRENITDWALEKFRAQYGDASITKWDIFHYVYALLHHPAYRERYAANLKRELPRIPFAGAGIPVGAGLVPARVSPASARAGTSPAPTEIFRAFVEAGARLADIHVNYEGQPEYQLERIENPRVPLDWRVERMKLGKDKTRIVYNDFLTLAGVPAAAFDYRLGNRSALEWVIDQYQVSTDKRSRITNDPNRADDPQYVVRLVGQVINVSLETVRLVRALPALGLAES